MNFLINIVTRGVKAIMNSSGFKDSRVMILRSPLEKLLLTRRGPKIQRRQTIHLVDKPGKSILKKSRARSLDNRSTLSATDQEAVVPSHDVSGSDGDSFELGDFFAYFEQCDIGAEVEI